MVKAFLENANNVSRVVSNHNAKEEKNYREKNFNRYCISMERVGLDSTLAESVLEFMLPRVLLYPTTAVRITVLSSHLGQLDANLIRQR